MIKAIFLSCASVIFIFLLSTDIYGSYDRSSEVDRYIDGLNSKLITVRIDTAKNITKSSITQSRLFDEVQKILVIALYPDSYDRLHIDEIAWLCKALASSGDSKYEKVLNRIAKTNTNKKVKHYASESLRSLELYKIKNNIINDTSFRDQELSPEENRVANMIKSDMVKLKRDGAKIVYRTKDTNKKLYEIIKEELVKNHKKKYRDREHADAMAWFCKALTSSKNKEYLPVLREIVLTTYNFKIQKFCAQGLKVLSDAE